MGGQSLWLKKNLVRFLLGKSHYLILNRWAITWPHPFDYPCKKRGTVEATANNVMSETIGMGNPARQLAGMLRGIAEEGKDRDRIIARLLGNRGVINASAVQARGGARL